MPHEMLTYIKVAEIKNKLVKISKYCEKLLNKY